MCTKLLLSFYKHDKVIFWLFSKWPYKKCCNNISFQWSFVCVCTKLLLSFQKHDKVIFWLFSKWPCKKRCNDISFHWSFKILSKKQNRKINTPTKVYFQHYLYIWDVQFLFKLIYLAIIQPHQVLFITNPYSEKPFKEVLSIIFKYKFI